MEWVCDVHRFCIHKQWKSLCRSRDKKHRSYFLIELDRNATIVFIYRLEAEVKKKDKKFEIWWFDFWNFVRKRKEKKRQKKERGIEKDKGPLKPIIEIIPPYGHKIEIYNPLICTNCYQDFFGRDTPKYHAVTTKKKLQDERSRWQLTAKSEIKESLGPTTARGPALAYRHERIAAHRAASPAASRAASEGRRKLKRAAKHAVALKKRGFKPDLIDDRGPSTEYEEFWEKRMKQDYKLLEDEFLLEVLDSKHGMGRYLNRAWNEWKQRAEIISFWDFLEQNRARYGHSVSYIKKTERPNYRIRIERGRLLQGSKESKSQTPFDTSNMLSISGIKVVEGWGIYVQSMSNEIYSGGAFIKGQCEIRDGKIINWTCPLLHHSSFLEGKPVRCAGEWMVRDGKLISISMVTGHYKTPAPLFVEFLKYLRSRRIDLKVISVKWLWPDENKLHYYSAEDFCMATDIEFKKEPYGRQGPLREITDPSTPHMAYIKPDPHSGHLDCAPSSRIPPRKVKEFKKFSEVVGHEVDDYAVCCTMCDQEEQVCKCHLKPRR